MNNVIEVDIIGICSVTHNCTGCAEELMRCCSSYDIIINKKELYNIVGYLPLAAEFSPKLVYNNEYKNIFEKIEPNYFCLDTYINSLCHFAYFDQNKLLCSLHTSANKYNIPLKEIKPMVCILWPLAIYEDKTTILSIDDDTFEFKCNKFNKFENNFLCPSIVRNIDLVFGIKFRTEIERAARIGLNWIKIQY